MQNSEEERRTFRTLYAPKNSAEIKLRAEQKAGEILGEMIQHEGGTVPSWNRIPEGITKKHSHRWQLQALVPEDVFE